MADASVPATADEFAIDLDHTFSVRDAEGERIAHVVLYPRHGVLWLTDVWVSGKVRKRGLASKMLRTAVERFGREDIYLQIRAYTDQPLSDMKLREWYGGFGFVETPVPGVLMRLATAA
jgi:GNAT superfamily N-acetyltransferase